VEKEMKSSGTGEESREKRKIRRKNLRYM